MRRYLIVGLFVALAASGCGDASSTDPSTDAGGGIDGDASGLVDAGGADAGGADAGLVDAGGVDAGGEDFGIIRVLTYNVAGLPVGISGGNPLVNTPLISPLLNLYNLALVQEDFTYHAELVADVMHLNQSVPMPPTELMVSDGLNRFSDSPFVGHSRHQWLECNGYVSNGTDCLAPKGFSVARHTIATGIEIDIYNFHADAGTSSGDRNTRVAQVTQLVDYIGQHSAGMAVLVAGDTNMRAADETTLDMLLTGASLADSCRSLSCSSPSTIDRVFFRSSATVTLVAQAWWFDGLFVDQNGDDLSDHKAIGVEIAWQRE
jgi:hypothetical protein